jgi:hypothetical protein
VFRHFLIPKAPLRAKTGQRSCVSWDYRLVPAAPKNKSSFYFESVKHDPLLNRQARYRFVSRVEVIIAAGFAKARMTK